VRRDDQLAILEDALLAAQRGEGRFVVLAGEAGIGKTRLANELVGEARRLGCAVLWGGCSEAEISLPYLPFVEAIGNFLDAEDHALSDLMYRRTEGNPFVLEEMLREAPEGVGTAASSGRGPVDEMGIPETVRDTILLRLARLGRDDVAILEAAAVLGRTFD